LSLHPFESCSNLRINFELNILLISYYIMDEFDMCLGGCGNIIPLEQYFCLRPECLTNFAFSQAKVKKPKIVNDLPVEVVDKFQPYESLYELTLTIDVDDVYTLRECFNKITSSAMFEIKGYIACVELTKSGLPHIHALLFSKKKYIDGSKIKKLYKYRYECKRVRHPGNYYDYINKERDNPAVIDYCAAKGVDQLWELIN